MLLRLPYQHAKRDYNQVRYIIYHIRTRDTDILTDSKTDQLVWLTNDNWANTALSSLKHMETFHLGFSVSNVILYLPKEAIREICCWLSWLWTYWNNRPARGMGALVTHTQWLTRGQNKIKMTKWIIYLFQRDVLLQRRLFALSFLICFQFYAKCISLHKRYLWERLIL